MSEVAVRCGLDIAKHVFALHAVNKHGKTVLKKQLQRKSILVFLLNFLAVLLVSKPAEGVTTGREN